MAGPATSVNTGRWATLRAIPRPVWVLGFVSLLMDISSEMVQTLLPLYLVAGLGLSAVAVGLIEGVSVCVAMVTRLASGVISDRIGRRKTLAVAGYGLAALSKLIIPLASSLDGIVAAKAIDRVGKGIRGAPRDAMVADAAPPGLRGACFGLRKSLDTVGGFVGPLVAIVLMLALSNDYVTVFWVAAFPAFLAVALLAWGVREPQSPPQPSRPLAWREVLRFEAPVWRVMAVAVVFTLARFSEAFLLLRAQQLGLAVAWVPLVMVVMHAVYGLAAYPVGRLADRFSRAGLLAISLAVLLAADALLAAADGMALFMAGIVLWGLHMGCSQGVLSALLADAVPASQRATAFGLMGGLTGLAVLLGNVGAGVLWEILGPAWTFLGGAVAAVACLLLLAWQRRSMG